MFAESPNMMNSQFGHQLQISAPVEWVCLLFVLPFWNLGTQHPPHQYSYHVANTVITAQPLMLMVPSD